ncbi:hypothetical protein [Gilliamella sp. ESL0254]|nr:hypothetical protein [Gilliamella sp. ESL0254]
MKITLTINFLNRLHGVKEIGAEKVEWLEFLNRLHGVKVELKI